MAAGDDRFERAVSELRRRNVRMTPARRALLGALLRHRAHVGADELAAEVQRQHPEVHLSTVYRALDAFEREGVVTHVHLGHGRAIYHLTDEIHHHAVCEGCGAVTEVPLGVFEDLNEQLERRIGFAIDAHHFALVGHCRSCRA